MSEIFRGHFPTFGVWYRRLLLHVRAMRGVMKSQYTGLPLIRFSVRRMMLAAVVLVIALGLVERRSRALTSADLHRSQIVSSSWACSRSTCFRFYVDGFGHPATAQQIKNSEWHQKLYSKYRRAASYPWLPIEPDPLEPE